MQTEHRIGIGISVMVCVVISGLGILASTAPLIQSPKEPQKPHELPLAESRQKINRTSKTDALEVVNTSAMNGFVKVALKNVSNKNVNGIQLAINGGILQIEFLDADLPEHQKLLPGAIYEEMFSFNGGSGPIEVAVLAVTFDDKTSSGQTSLANEIFETRKGNKKQLVRFRRLLSEALRSPEADSIVVLDKLKTQANDLPEGDNEDSGAMKMGQLQAKQRLIQEIDFVTERHFRHPGLRTIRESLSEIETRHERRLRMLE